MRYVQAHLAAGRLLRLVGAIVPGNFAEPFRKYLGSKKLPRS
jgi:hypothetical protein